MTVESIQVRGIFQSNSILSVMHCGSVYSIYIPFLNSLHLKLQRMEDVQVEVAPGSYAVSAGRYGAPRQHTHIVRLEPGQTVDLGFSL